MATSSLPRFPDAGDGIRDHAKAIVDAYYISLLAPIILRFRSRSPKADLNRCKESEQREIREAAALALLSNDAAAHRIALYAAANAIKDLGELTYADRRDLVGALEHFLTLYRQVLAGDRPEDRRRFALLALADLEGGQS